jgi:hypothetical protein
LVGVGRGRTIRSGPHLDAPFIFARDAPLTAEHREPCGRL